ncbi:MAG: hypothetical protein ILO10_02385 [Kiritimatiellae bacterium]|nr:hypothetical protein [Kiritimatiellia bacterium]
MTPTSAILRNLLDALSPVASRHGARLAVSTDRAAALNAFFDAPAGCVAILVPGAQAVEDAQGPLAVIRESVSLIVGHRLPPTAAPAEGLYASVAGAEPFLDTLEDLRAAVIASPLPEDAGTGFWQFDGRTPVSVEGVPLPAYELQFHTILAGEYAAIDPDPLAPPPFPGDLPPPPFPQ